MIFMPESTYFHLLVIIAEARKEQNGLFGYLKCEVSVSVCNRAV